MIVYVYISKNKCFQTFFWIMDHYLMDFCVANLDHVYLFCLWYRKLRWFYSGAHFFPHGPCVCFQEGLFYIYLNQVYASLPVCM